MTKNRLSHLRKLMTEKQIDALVIASNDPHFSEYPPARWEARAWFSGFTGSAGTLVVTAEAAGLWTDSRYFIQAEKQLKGSGIDLMKVHDRNKPGIVSWFSGQLKRGQNLAFISDQSSPLTLEKYKSKLKPLGIRVSAVNDFLDMAWPERPLLPKDPLFEHRIEYAGLERNKKIDQLRSAMKAKECEVLLITTLDDIAWVLNLRSTDVPCNPVFVAYLTLTLHDACLFIDPDKLSTDIKQALEEDNISICPYEDIGLYLKALSTETKVMADKLMLNMNLYACLNDNQWVNEPCPAVLLKACKSPAEIQHIENAMIKDGIALTRAFMWLEKNIKNQEVTEDMFAVKLAEYRSQQDDYYGESFNAIVGFNDNGAVIHYRPEPGTSNVIKANGILLVDSGGQYHDGTTDITRTIALEKPSDEQMHAYTLVLKGMIALTKAIFPEGTSGAQLDTLARQYLWSSGMNYGHGTGHGVGFFNAVHEGPQSISPSCQSRASGPILAGMVSSNEPGYYEENKYGIRIENLIQCQASNHKGFLEFRTLTLFPIDTTLIQKKLMDSEEREWLNKYHRLVLDKLKDRLNDEERGWLQEKCRFI